MIDTKFSDFVHFDPVEHKYTEIKTGKTLISASQLIHSFAPPFDESGEITKNCAIKKGVTVEELKAEWKKINQDSLDKGHAIHADLEYFVNTGKIRKSPYKNIVKQFKKIEFNGKLQSEIQLFSLKHRIAGTCDLVELFDDGSLNLLDFKSNKKWTTYNFFGTRLLHPFSHMFETHFNTYSLQLNLYAFLLEELGYWVKDLTVFWINPKTEIMEVKKLPFLPRETKLLINAAPKLADSLKFENH